MANCYGCDCNIIQNIIQTLELFEAAEENYRNDAAVDKGVMGEEKFWWILMCRAGKQSFTQVLPWIN